MNEAEAQKEAGCNSVEKTLLVTNIFELVLQSRTSLSLSLDILKLMRKRNTLRARYTKGG